VLTLVLVLSVLLPAAGRTTAQGTPPDPQAAQPAALPLSKDTVSTTTTKNEVPRIALSATQLHVTWKSGTPPSRSRTAYSQRLEAGGTWPPQQLIGGNGSGTYHTSSVAVSPVDTSVHLIWVDASQGGDGYVFYSRLQANGQWTSPVRISSVGRFAHYPHLTVDTQGRIWAIWSAENPPQNDNIFYRYSTDNGATWQPGSEGLLDNRNAKRPWIAADRSGGVHAVWWRNGGIYYARWTGSSWRVEGIPSGGFNADPSVTIDPSGTVHVAWRRQRGFGEWDIYYATRPANSSSWSITRLYEGGNVDKTVVIYADESGRLHLTWFDTLGGAEIWYTTKAPGGSWLSPPQNVSNDGIFNINADVVGRTDAGGTRAHVVFETWFGGDADVRIQHVQIGGMVPSAQPVIENNNAFTNKTTLSVSFSNVSGDPTQIRWRWGAPPSDTANDSNGWQPFANPMAIPVPGGLGTNICQQLTLYTQVRNTTVIESQPKQDSITFDNGVQVVVRAVNPNRRDVPPPTGVADTLAQGGASDGDPNYTREPRFFLGIYDGGDCAGLKNFTVANGAPTDIPAGGFSSRVPLPDSADPGAKSFNIVVTDNTGNTVTVPVRITYDPANTSKDPTNPNTDGLPVLASGGALSGDDDTTSIIRTLSFSNISITDNLYGQQGENLPPGRQFWGLWVANSRTDVTTDTTSLNWYPVEVPDPQASFSIRWSIFSGLPTNQHTPGDYYIYVRFLDGAGNPSARMLTTRLTLAEGFKLPTTYLPTVPR
jgi:hypothetical protein